VGSAVSVPGGIQSFSRGYQLQHAQGHEGNEYVEGTGRTLSGRPIVDRELWTNRKPQSWRFADFRESPMWYSVQIKLNFACMIKPQKIS
jgi:hypothetical protein